MRSRAILIGSLLLAVPLGCSEGTSSSTVTQGDAQVKAAPGPAVKTTAKGRPLMVGPDPEAITPAPQSKK
jgi:hypothetical protein